MCGVAGFSGSFGGELLGAMNESMAHRGPDDSGLWRDSEHQIGLAHRRLSIIDLSDTGHQPMRDTRNRAVIVYNGELYNYRELRQELVAQGIKFSGSSDTEVLLNLYLRYGEDMFAKLNGIFAFALWDREQRKLLVARDGFGVKPLYYAETNRGFLFASELKSLLHEPSLDRTLDHTAIEQYITYLWAPSPRTPIRGVKKLEPGCALVIAEGQVERRFRFYDLPYDSPESCMSEEEAIAVTRQRVEQAVERQMVSDVPVGAFLSGGLDSSAVATIAARLSGTPLDCFTIAFRGDGWEREGMTADLPYARKVADNIGARLHIVEAGPEMAQQLETMIYHLDEPQADPAPLNALMISRLAREQGIKVLLSGAGGDDIFTGYRRHYAVAQERYWAFLPKPARVGLSRMASALPVSSPMMRRFSKAFRYAGLDGDFRIASYFYWTTPAMLNRLRGPALRQAATDSGRDEPLVSLLQNISPDTDPVNKMLYLEGKCFLADHNLNYTDKMSMAAGVEVRVPLLDADLVAHAAALPVSMKQRGRVGKWIFKKAMEPLLSHDVIYRPKTGFGAPLRHWLRYELKEMVDDILTESTLVRRGLFDPVAVATLRADDEAGRVDGTYTIFSLLCIELWLQRFIDQRID